MEGSTYGADAKAFRALVRSVFTAAAWPGETPRVLGPATWTGDAWSRDVAEAAKGGLDAWTYHYYSFGDCSDTFPAPPPSWGLTLDPKCLAKTTAAATRFDWVYPFLAEGGEVWAGETAIRTNGGSRPDVDNTFRSSFYYVNQLGTVSASGNAVAARQTLSGGEYALLNHTTFAPHPDFWIAAGFHALAVNFSVLVTPAPGGTRETGAVRAFAHCARGGGRFVQLSNLATAAPADVRLNFTTDGAAGDGAEVGPLHRWTFTGSLTDPLVPVSINGEPWAGGGGADLAALPEPGEVACCSLQLPPASITFIVAPRLAC